MAFRPNLISSYPFGPGYHVTLFVNGKLVDSGKNYSTNARSIEVQLILNPDRAGMTSGGVAPQAFFIPVEGLTQQQVIQAIRDQVSARESQGWGDSLIFLRQLGRIS